MVSLPATVKACNAALGDPKSVLSSDKSVLGFYAHDCALVQAGTRLCQPSRNMNHFGGPNNTIGSRQAPFILSSTQIGKGQY